SKKALVQIAKQGHRQAGIPFGYCKNYANKQLIFVLHTQVILTTWLVVVRQAITRSIDPLVICLVSQVQGFKRELDIVIELIRCTHVDIGGAVGTFTIVVVTTRCVSQITCTIDYRNTRTEGIIFVVNSTAGGVLRKT